ncbi:hypothetical protein PENSPDRAFT_680876 [Peniophora sp. CONT]|nr:hypothetical protein PENSPDRAFT_680876 [Peniophora sp. CONT]
MPVTHLATTNAALPISRVLIPEVFAHIILLALDEDRPWHIGRHPSSAGDTRPVVVYLGAAISASHVCYAWRVLCIGTPLLWARQIGWIPVAASIFLRRSGSALVDIYTTHGIVDLPGIVSIDSSRVRSIVWHDDTFQSLSLDKSAPMLRQMLSDGPVNLVSLEIKGPVMTSDRFCSLDILNAPRLGGVHLDNVYIPLQAPRLAHLELSDVPIVLSQFIDLLRNTPLLEVLDLQQCKWPHDFEEDGIDHHSQQIQSLQPVELPRLNSLILDDQSINREVRRPYRVLLDMLHIQPESLDVGMDLGITAPLFSRSVNLACRRGPPLSVRLEEVFNIWRGVRPAQLPHLPLDNNCSSDVRIAYIDALQGQAIGEMIYKLRLPELQYVAQLELTVHVAHYMEEDDLRAFLCAMPNVSTYWIGSCESSNGDPADWESQYDRLILALIPRRGLFAGFNAEAMNATEQELCPLPHLKTWGINIPDFDSHLIENVRRTLTSRMEEPDIPLLRALSLPRVPQPFGDDVGRSDAAADLALLALTVHWGSDSAQQAEDGKGGRAYTHWLVARDESAVEEAGDGGGDEPEGSTDGEGEGVSSDESDRVL